MITSSGAKCDVCDKYILPIIGDEMVNPFTVEGISETLHSCNSCKKIVLNAFKEKNFKLLPAGRLKKVFENETKKEEK